MEAIVAHVMRELSHNPPTTLRELRMRVHQMNELGFKTLLCTESPPDLE